MPIQIQTDRLLLREMTQADFPALCQMLYDPVVMKAYEGAFTQAEAQAWLDRQISRYRKDGLGLWAVVLRETGRMIGQCGLTWQEAEGRTVLEVGYLFSQAYWHRGYAAEAARACRDFAFDTLGAKTVYSIIRDTNAASRAVALRNGMHRVGGFVKHYRGVEMPHDVFAVSAPER